MWFCFLMNNLIKHCWDFWWRKTTEEKRNRQKDTDETIVDKMVIFSRQSLKFSGIKTDLKQHQWVTTWASLRIHPKTPWNLYCTDHFWLEPTKLGAGQCILLLLGLFFDCVKRAPGRARQFPWWKLPVSLFVSVLSCTTSDHPCTLSLGEGDGIDKVKMSDFSHQRTFRCCGHKGPNGESQMFRLLSCLSRCSVQPMADTIQYKAQKATRASHFC